MTEVYTKIINAYKRKQFPRSNDLFKRHAMILEYESERDDDDVSTTINNKLDI